MRSDVSRPLGEPNGGRAVSWMVLLGGPLFVMFVGWTARSIWPYFRRLWQGCRRRRMSIKITEDYRVRARTNFGVALSTFVDVGATREGSRMLAVEISRQVSGGAVLAIIGRRGEASPSSLSELLHCTVTTAV